jgi:hypothetical protein
LLLLFITPGVLLLMLLTLEVFISQRKQKSISES